MTTKVRQSTIQQDNISIDWLSDVDTSTAAPTNGQALVYQTSTTKWVPGNVSSGNASFTRTSFTASANQTVFSVAYTVGFITVHYNGVLLPAADYTATTGSTVVLTVAALANDIIEIITYAGSGGGSGVTPIVENENTISANRVITAGSNGMSVGYMTVNTGVSVTVASGQRWAIL